MMKFSAALIAAAILAWPLAALAADPVLPSTDPALSAQANADYLAANAKKKGVIVKPDGLQIRMLQNGFGRRPAATDSVEVYYTGALINGKVFDGTSPGLPANFKVSQVIPGWLARCRQVHSARPDFGIRHDPGLEHAGAPAR
jgi:hypothetical protein